MKLRALLTGFVGLLAAILLMPPLVAAIKHIGPHAHLYHQPCSYLQSQLAHNALHTVEVSLGILLLIYMVSFALPVKRSTKTTTYTVKKNRNKPNQADLFFNAKN